MPFNPDDLYLGRWILLDALRVTLEFLPYWVQISFLSFYLYCERKMKILLLLQLSISLILVNGCRQKFQEPSNKQDPECQTSEVYQAYMDFAVKIYGFISSRTARAPPNLFFSPLSIYTTLSMLSLGARSTTRMEILQGMGLNASKTDKELHGDYSKLLQVVNQQTKNDGFELGNDIFIGKSADIFAQYQQNVTSYYNASIQTISFSDPQNAEKTINTLISNRTHNKIQNIVENLDSRTLMVLVDYSVFQAKWKSEFDPQNTEMRKFSVNEERTVSVPMMRRQGTYKTYKDKENDCIVVEVPYAGNMALLLIMPQLGDLYRVERKLTPEGIKKYFSSTKTSVLDLSMPKVTINSSVNVRYALLVMDFGNIFSSDNADFSRMSNKRRLKVSEIYHQSYTNITEGGTEASGVTYSQSNYIFSNPKLKVDRPFLMLIYHKITETLLWMGRVTDPSQQ